MAILKDYENDGTYIEFKIIRHNPLPSEGTYLTYTYYQNNKVIKESEFGWTNTILTTFLNMLKSFPEEKWKGYFSHYEENVEMRWIYEYKTDSYLIIFMDSGYLYTLKAIKNDIKTLGDELEAELYSFK